MPQQILPNKSQMKAKLARERDKAAAEAIRLIRNKDDMFERYLKKPT